MNFELTILGSSSGCPTSGTNQTAQLLNIQGRHYLIDCGEATQIQLMKYGLSYQKIKHIFISHLHPDHYIGLIGLLNTMSLNDRKDELHIYSAVGIEDIINVQLKHSKATLRYPIYYHPTNSLEVAIVCEDENIIVKSIPLEHKIACTGFIFTEKEHPRKIKKGHLDKANIPHEAFESLKKGEDYTDKDGNKFSWNDLTEPPLPARSYAFISDTKYLETIIPEIQDVDLLYHEATFKHELSDKAEARYHSTNRQAAMMAKQAKVGRLIIGHFSTRYKEFDSILEEAREVFPNTFLAVEGEIFSIPFKKQVSE